MTIEAFPCQSFLRKVGKILEHGSNDFVLLLYSSVTKRKRKFRFLPEPKDGEGVWLESTELEDIQYQALSDTCISSAEYTKLAKWRVEFTKRKSEEFIFARGNSVSELRRVKTS